MPPNQPISIDVFSEGATEKGVVEKLCSRGICPYSLTERGGDGDPAFLRKLRLQLRNWVEQGQSEPLRVLVLRDWDKHTGKTTDDLCKSVLDIVRQYRPEAELIPHANHDNVFSCQTDGGLSVSLHLATRFYAAHFVKATIDDYVLELALLPATAERLLESSRERGQRQKPTREWPISAAVLIEKVTREIPELLQKNRIPQLLEAKEYVRFYAALLQKHSSPATFAAKVQEHADEQDIRTVFAPLMAAAQFLETAA